MACEFWAIIDGFLGSTAPWLAIVHHRDQNCGLLSTCVCGFFARTGRNWRPEGVAISCAGTRCSKQPWFPGYNGNCFGTSTKNITNIKPHSFA